MPRERVALNTACFPDSALTGYPGAYQWFDKRYGIWCWLFTGSFGNAMVLKSKRQVQKRADLEKHLPVGTRVRFVYVKRWVPKRAKRGWGWHAVLDHALTVEVTKRKRREPTCYWFSAKPKKPAKLKRPLGRRLTRRKR